MCCVLLWANGSLAQVSPIGGGNITPNGMLDSVFDQFGHAYSLRNLAIGNRVSVSGSGSGTSGGAGRLVMPSCSSGYFQLYLDSACGLDSFATNSVQNDRLQVFCKVLHDISDFIQSPCLSTGQTINVWVRSANSVGLPSNAAGEATSFFSVPSTPTVSGIVDNTVWQTIVSGKDAYTGIASPVITSGGFFHCMMAYNFSTVNWNTSLTVAPTSSQFDLYSTVLHEMMHALGIRSLISSSGASNLNYNYYSRFDQFLKSGNTNLISQPTGTCSPMYTYAFGPSVSVLHPDPSHCYTDSTVCAHALQFVGTSTLNIYTPNCWEAGSSVSHFEDECPPISNNNGYYAMANAAPYGAIQRFLRPEERHALCDIGYTVNTSFGDPSNVNLNYASYSGSVCPGAQVAGTNDGIDTNGIYTFITQPGVSITINSSGLASSILRNDHNADSISCLEVVMGGSGTFNTTHGISGTTITYTPSSSSTVGTHLLRYVPINRTTGKIGNITYVYIRVSSIACAGSSCDMVVNGGFESSIGCGAFNNPVPSSNNNNVPTTVDCWDQLGGTPNLYSTNCQYPFAGGWYDVGIPTTETIPSTSSHPNSIALNNHFIGFAGALFSNGFLNSEAVQTSLTTGLTTGTTYKISFWAKITYHFNNSFQAAYNELDTPAHIQFCASANTMAPLGLGLTFPLPPSIVPLRDTLIPADSQWHSYSLTFTYTGATTLNNLIVLDAINLNPSYPFQYYLTYILLDDVSLKVADSVRFTPPDTLSTCDTLHDLMTYVSGVSVGTFNGNGVLQSGTTYGFCPAIAYGINGPGLQSITFNYTDINGCHIHTSKQVYVNNVSRPITAATNYDTACSGQQITLTATGGANYRWHPSAGMSCDTCATTYAYPTDSTIYYVVSIDSNHCPAVASVTVIVPDSAGIVPYQNTLFACNGNAVVLFATTNPLITYPYPTGPTPNCTYQWYRNGTAISGATQYYLNAMSSGSYYVGITLNGSCTRSSASVTVTIDTPPITLSPTNPYLCPGGNLNIFEYPFTYPTVQWSYATSMSGPFTLLGGSYITNANTGGIYKVIVTDAFGCTNTAYDTVYQDHPTASVTPSGTASACSGVSVTIHANRATGLSYSWLRNGSPITPSATDSFYNAATAGTYSVSETDIYGCVDTSSGVAVTLLSLPTATISPTGTTSLCSGTSTTLTASTGAGYTYVWYRDGGTGYTALTPTTSSISVNSAGAYKVKVTNSSGCATTSVPDTITLMTAPRDTLTAAATTICPGSTVRLSANTGTGYTYQWKLNGSNISGATGATYNATSAGRYTVVISASGCSTTSATDTISTGPIWPYYLGFGHRTMSLCIGAPDSMYTITGTGYRYKWYHNGILASDTTSIYPFTAVNLDSYRVVVTIPGYCPTSSVDDTIFTTGPCGACALWGSDTFNIYTPTVINSTLSGHYYIDHPVTISGSVTFNHAVIQMGPHATITVPGGTALTIDDSHLFACSSDMWGGIRASGGTVTVRNNSLIEDADTAVYLPGSGSLTSNNSMFNRNTIGVCVANRASLSGVLAVASSIFTCRNIGSTATSWISCSTYLSSITTRTSYPYVTETYNSDTCHNGHNAQAGIYLYALGTTNVSSYPFTFNDITVGSTASSDDMNLFDNLNAGVSGNRANVTLQNNKFIHCGNGVYFNSDPTIFYGRLRIWNNSTRNTNSFYDCMTGVLVEKAFEVIGQNAYMISNHTTSSTGTGVFGYNLAGGVYHDAYLTGNTIINITNAISVIKPLFAYAAGLKFNQNPAVVNGQGTFIKNDTLLVVPAGNAISNGEFMDIGINAQMITNGSVPLPSSGLYCDSNHIHDAYSGIVINNVRNTAEEVENNYISTRFKPGYAVQGGVYMWYSWGGRIAQNNIRGNAIIADNNWRGVYMADNSEYHISCDSTQYLPIDFEFEGQQAFFGHGATWINNNMGNSQNGFVLGGTIGTQGNANYGIGDVWYGPWAGVFYSTYTSNSSTLPQNSTLYVFASDATQVPTNNSSWIGSIGPSVYSAHNGIMTATIRNSGSCEPYVLSIANGKLLPFESAATNQGFFAGNSGLTQFLGQMQLYQYMPLDSALFDSSSILPIFFANAANSRIGYLNNIENYIVQGYLDSARVLLKTDVPGNPSFDYPTGVVIDDSGAADGVVANYKNFYGAYINYLDSSMTGTDSSTIVTLAGMCPNTDGAVVYQARALYAVLYNDLTLFNDTTCYNPVPDKHGKAAPSATSEVASEQKQSYRLYPNPNNGLLYVAQATPDAKPVQAKVWNENGQCIYKGELIFKANTLRLVLGDRTPGLYLLELMDSEGNNYALKFVVN